MSETKQEISSGALIELANQLLSEHKEYIEGMTVYEVVEQHGVLVFKGEAFLDGQGLPTFNSTVAFNLYKWLCHQLSSQYILQD